MKFFIKPSVKTIAMIFGCVWCGLFPLASWGQTYKFDLLTKYVLHRAGEASEKMLISNSYNMRYQLFLMKNGKVNEAYLSDYNRNKMHYFRFKETTVNEKPFFDFEYVESWKLRVGNQVNEWHAGFQTVRSDSVYRTVKMTMYRDRKDKEIAYEVALKIKKHGLNLFPVYRASVLHPFEQRDDIDLGEGGIVESAVVLNSEWSVQARLAEFRKITLVLEVPVK